MIKIGREEPVASMDGSGKIIWARHNEIQTVNVKSLGPEHEVLQPCRPCHARLQRAGCMYCIHSHYCLMLSSARSWPACDQTT